MFIVDVIGARDAKRSDMAGCSHANRVVNVHAGFPAKRKSFCTQSNNLSTLSRKRFYFVGEEERDHNHFCHLGLFGNG